MESLRIFKWLRLVGIQSHCRLKSTSRAESCRFGASCQPRSSIRRCRLCTKPRKKITRLNSRSCRGVCRSRLVGTCWNRRLAADRSRKAVPVTSSSTLFGEKVWSKLIAQPLASLTKRELELILLHRCMNAGLSL